MCLSPIKISNPNFSKVQYASQHGDLVRVPKNLSPKSRDMLVPCGICHECRMVRYNAILQRSLVEAMSSYMFFVTLTFNNDNLWSVELLDKSRIYFANYDYIINLFKRVRNKKLLGDREFRYLCVNEYGDKTNRPHFHIIIYVARMDDDTETTPYDIEKVLYDNLKLYYGENIGTRKNPIYDTAFTYARYFDARKNKWFDNYRVTYVEPSNPLQEMKTFIMPDLDTVKTTKYLIGYVQKPSEFEVQVDKSLKHYKESDPELYRKLRHILGCHIRYSKGFGCGFMNGKKYYLPRISVRCSSNAIFYSDLVKCLPKDYDEFKELYPQVDRDLHKFIKYDIYRKYRKLKWKQCLYHMTTEEYMNHCLYVRYFRKEFTQKYRSYFCRQKNTQATVSYYYKYAHNNTYYAPPTVSTTKPEDSPVYRFLRKGVEEGIASKVPYLAFKMIGQQKFTALCRFYKERVCTIEDTKRMYDAIGVKDYEEWQALFEKQKNNRVSNVFSGNQIKYYNPHKKITQSTCKNEKNYLSLHQLKGEDQYRYLFSDRKQWNAVQKGV